jgi:hypothetical protein
MQKAKLKILFAQFAYAGNGGVATVLPHYVPWFAKVYKQLSADPRVEQVAIKQYGDIPLDIERNRVVFDAKQHGFDVIVMLDSDNVPDLYLGHRSDAKSFIETSFNFLYEREIRGIPTVVCAPYCGPPPHPTKGGSENVYVFFATHDEGDDSKPDFVGRIKFEAYSREHAAIMRGIQVCAAGPTGCIMYSTSAFDLMPVHKQTKDEILDDLLAGKISKDRAKQLINMESWFYYESPDGLRTSKASTEDVTNTREIQMAGVQKHGEPVVFCNWDAWAGHFKPKCVGAPSTLKIESVSNLFREAVANNISSQDQAMDIDFTGGEPLPDPKVPFRGGVGNDGTGDEYIIGSDGATVAPPKPIKRTLRLGHAFDESLWQEHTLLAIRSIAEQESRTKPIRVAVFGDKTGELSLAPAIKNATVYHICDDRHSPVSDFKDVRLVRSFPWDTPQDLDLVVCTGETSFSAIYMLCDRHIRQGGTLIYAASSLGGAHETIAEMLDNDHAKGGPEWSYVQDVTLGLCFFTKKIFEDSDGEPAM